MILCICQGKFNGSQHPYGGFNGSQHPYGGFCVCLYIWFCMGTLASPATGTNPDVHHLDSFQHFFMEAKKQNH